MALYPAFSAKQCCRQFVGAELQRAKQFGFRWRLQSWAHRHIHALGSFCGLHVPTAAQALATARSIIALMVLCGEGTQPDEDRGADWVRSVNRREDIWHSVSRDLRAQRGFEIRN